MNSTTLNDYAKIEVCRGDFYLMLQNAMLEAGGTSDIGSLKKMTLEGVVNILAQNGIRMVYMPSRHMSSVQFEWKEKPTGRREDGPLPKVKFDMPAAEQSNEAKPPIRRQLLCDMRDADLETSKDIDFREKYGDGPEAQ